MASLKPRNSNGKIALDKLNKELFIKSVTESRTETVDHFSFNKTRCKVLSESDKLTEGNGVLYWMSRDCRFEDNWALLFAQRLALKQENPLFVFFNIFEASYLYPSNRQFRFLLDGLKEIRNSCDKSKIGFFILNASPTELVEIVKKNNIGAIVCDFNPLRKPREWQELFLKSLPKNVPFVQVDAHNIVPCWLASNKQEIMAKTLRPKITKQLCEYLTGFPAVKKHKFLGKCDLMDKEVNIDDVYGHFHPLWEVEEVTTLTPGSKAALEILHSFLGERLKYYGINSNDPSKNTTSNLSYWIHFGHISAQRIALEVQSLESLYKQQVEKYLEELIVRKELADNYCYYNENYDNINGAAGWAFKTLNDHKIDKRTWVYTRDQLQKGETHDEMWNAAQMQLNREGKVHGYMRMYWCKKILEWTESPEKAIEYALWLNDTFGLDGSDPNGFVGVMWSICGVHDQGWKEREIFGKIRYMVDYSLRRKFDMEAYCQQYGTKLSNNSNTKKKGVKRKAK